MNFVKHIEQHLAVRHQSGLTIFNFYDSMHFKIFLFYRMSVLPACISVNHVHSCCLRWSEEGIGSLRTGLQMVVSHCADAGTRMGEGPLQE